MLGTLATYSNLNKATGYQIRTFDMLPYKGQTVTLSFAMTEDSSLQTSFVVDDFALNATTGTPTPTPTPNPTPTPTPNPTPTPAPSALLNFDGLGNGGGYTPNAAPPDTNGAIGATQYVQWVNEAFAVFDEVVLRHSSPCNCSHAITAQAGFESRV